MNFFPFHIGDFNNSTRHLTRVERSVYRDTLDLYYDTESPLPKDFKALCRKLLCRSEEEIEALKMVLSEYFDDKDGVYSNSRCEKEIEKYRRNTSAKAKAGIASAAARKQKSTRVEQALYGCATNQEPRTKNQEPRTSICLGADAPPVAKAPSKRKQELDFSSWLSNPSEQVLKDWLAMRKAKKAPVSQTVVNQFGQEINKAFQQGRTADECLALCVTKGWQGFKFQWMLNEENPYAGYQSTVKPSRSERNDAALIDYFAKLDAEEGASAYLDSPVQPEAGDGGGGFFGSRSV